MKNVFLTEKQIQYIHNENRKEYGIPSKIFNALENKESNIPLDDKEFSKKILTKRFDEIKKDFTDDISQIPLEKVSNHFNKLMRLCQEKEKNIRPQLEKLCYNTLVQLFNIPEDEIIFKCELVDFIDNGLEFHISPDTNEDYEYNSLDEIDGEGIEVQKRRLIDSLVYGVSMSLFEKAKKIYINELFDIDEELPHLYSKLIKINEYLLFNVDDEVKDDNHHQGGFVKVVLGNEEKMSNIDVKALTFPILLIESIKGIMELISSNGLPDDFNVAKNVLNKADILKEEPWDMRFGVGLWNMVTLNRDIEPKIIPDFFGKLIDIDAKDFISLFMELANNTKIGKQAIGELLDDCEYNSKYNDFEKDILVKQSEKDLISDGYFTEEELNV